MLDDATVDSHKRLARTPAPFGSTDKVSHLKKSAEHGFAKDGPRWAAAGTTRHYEYAGNRPLEGGETFCGATHIGEPIAAEYASWPEGGFGQPRIIKGEQL